MDLLERRPVVFTARSRHLFYARMLICKYVLLHDAIPLNPFTTWDYFLADMVERDLIRRGNNNLVRLADELWVFGPVADGVLFEIEYTIRLGKPLRFFSVGPTLEEIAPLPIRAVTFEPGVLAPDAAEDLFALVETYPGYVVSADPPMC